VASCRALKVTPHVAQNERRPGGSALDLRTNRGVARTSFAACLVGVAYNLLRIAKLCPSG